MRWGWVTMALLVGGIFASHSWWCPMDVPSWTRPAAQIPRGLTSLVVLALRYGEE